MKIANKISLSFSVALVILMGISLFTFYMIAKNNLEKAIYEHLETTASSRALHVETFLEEHKEKTEIIAHLALVESVLEATVSNNPDFAKLIEQTSLELKQFTKEGRELYEVFVINSQGMVIVSTNENNIGLDKSTDAYFLGAKTGVYIKDAYYSETTKKYSIAISAPVLDEETAGFLGVIVARINMKELANITSDKTGLGETGETYLVNKDGYMITKSRFTEGSLLTQKVDTENTKDLFANEARRLEHDWHEEVQIFTDYRGVSVLGTHIYIPETQWGLLAEIDVKEALAPLAKIKYFAIIIFCFALCAVYGISILISRAITAPIHRLHKGTEKIGAGKLDYKVGTTARDEIGQLSRAFDQMTVNLQKTTASRDEFDAANQHLEASQQQLRAANQQLDASNQQLRATEEHLRSMNHNLDERVKEVVASRKSLNEEIIMRKHSEERVKQAQARLEKQVSDLIRARDEVKATNQQLHANEEQLHSVNYNLNERLKELNCLYGFFRLAAETDKSIDEILADAVNLIPPSWQWPEITCARIVVDGKEFMTDGFVETEWKQIAEVTVSGERGGFVEVCYTQQKPQSDEGPFLEEEKDLIEALAEKIGCYIERKQAVSKLESINAELRDFVYIASHDLREPLRKISSFGYLLKESLGGKLDTDDQENFEFMIDGADRMTKMIEGLLVYSRLNKDIESFEAVDLNEIVEQLEQLELNVLLQETNTIIEVSDAMPKVFGDCVQIKQLLQNLISNGIKYREENTGPRIIITAKQIDGEQVRVEVRDNGIGIQQEYHDDIFKMFRRLHSRQKYEGTGIGLAVCKKIVKRHKGLIGVESEPGQGSVFWFALPLAKDAVLSEEMATIA